MGPCIGLWRWIYLSLLGIPAYMLVEPVEVYIDVLRAHQAGTGGMCR